MYSYNENGDKVESYVRENAKLDSKKTSIFKNAFRGGRRGEDGSGNNTYIYGGIGLVSLVIIAIVAYIYMKKKK